MGQQKLITLSPEEVEDAPRRWTENISASQAGNSRFQRKRLA